MRLLCQTLLGPTNGISSNGEETVILFLASTRNQVTLVKSSSQRGKTHDRQPLVKAYRL